MNNLIRNCSRARGLVVAIPLVVFMGGAATSVFAQEVDTQEDVEQVESEQRIEGDHGYLLGSITGGALTATTTLAAGYLTLSAIESNEDCLGLCATGPLGGAMLAWGLTTPATTALGTWVGGASAGGRGQFGITLLGSTLGGGLAGLGFAIATATEDKGLMYVALASMPILQAVGAVTAYHLSHEASARSEESFQIAPTGSLGPDGISLGVAGLF